jgi:hypothetical protein
MVERPDTSKCRIEVTHHGLGAPLQHSPQVIVLGKRDPHMRMERRMVRSPYLHLLCPLALGDVAEDAAIQRAASFGPRAQGELQRKFVTIFSQPMQFDRFPDKASLARRAQARQCLVMCGSVPCRHQEGEWLAQYFIFFIAKDDVRALVP